MINWIDVNYWLPEEAIAVLACNIYNDMFVAYYSHTNNRWMLDVSSDGDEGDFGGYIIPTEITHWTLLPPSPLRQVLTIKKSIKET